MPPSLQIDNYNITVFQDATGTSKRSQVSFVANETDTDAWMSLSKGNAGDPLRITNLATPTLSSDATTKEYVDALVHGLTVKAPVRAVETKVNRPLATLIAGVQIDDVTLAGGERVLLVAQSTASENGIWIVAPLPPAGQQQALPTRPTDFAASSVASGVYAFVDEGTEFKDKSFICITNQLDAAGAPNAVVGTNSLEWVQFGARNTALAGRGLVTGGASSLDVNVDNTTITIANNFVGIKNPDVKVKAERGLLRTATDGTTVSTAVTDSADASVMGATVALGQNITLRPDFTVVPDKAATNTFTDVNTFSSTAAATWTEATPGSEPVLTGAAVVSAGGLAVRHAIVAARTTLHDTADATSATAGGALLVQGGAGVAKQLFVGGDAHAAGTVHCDNQAASTAWSASGALTGSLVVEGGAAVRSDLQCASAIVHGVTDATSSTSGAVVISGGVGVAKNVNAGGTVHAAGSVHCDASTAAAWAAGTDPMTGALVVEGGAAVRAEVQCATAHLRSTVDATSTSTGALVVDGGAGIGGALYVAGSVTMGNSIQVSGTTASTSQSTGALTVSGGVGIAGDVYCQSTYNMSDERLKKNVCVIPDALSKICSLNGCTFEWNERMAGRENMACVGVIAQNVRDHAPLCVAHDASTDLYSVEYSKLVPYLIEAVKSLKRNYDDLLGQIIAPTPAESAPRGARKRARKL